MISDLFFFFKRCLTKKQLLFYLIFLFNFLGASLEGVSYTFLIAAISKLSGLSGFIFVKDMSFISLITCGLTSQLLKSFFCLSASLMNAKLAMQIQENVEKQIHKQIFCFSYACFQRYKQGELLNYIQSPNQFVRPFLEKANFFLVDIFLAIVSLTVMFLLSGSLTLLTLSFFALAFFLQKRFLKKTQKNSTLLSQEAEKTSTSTLQNLFGFKIIYHFNYQKKALEKIEHSLKVFASFSRKLLTLSAATTALHEMMGSLVVSLSLICGFLIFSSQSDEPLPLLLGFITIAYRLSGKVLGAMNNLNAIFGLKGSLKQIRNILETHDKEFFSEKKENSFSFKEEISFKNVYFKFPQSRDLALCNISCHIPKGQTIAFVGATGSGKSTLVDLLTGLYQPTKGQILSDGLILQENQFLAFRDKISIVTQDCLIFNDTIENNIKVGHIVASFDEIIKASQTAQCFDFIQKLPYGFQTIVGENGYRLSGGEKQRIALARALVRPAELMILDEATSQLDSETEAFIQKAILTSDKKQTWIIVAHRLSTIQHADLIYVLSQGQIIESGTHEELLKKEGNYAKLWRLQYKMNSHNEIYT